MSIYICMDAHNNNIIKNLNFYNVICILINLMCVQAAWKENWRGHGSGEHADICNHPQKVIEMLTAAGWSFHREC